MTRTAPARVSRPARGLALSALAALALALAACAPAAPSPTAPPPRPTEAPKPAAKPTEAPKPTAAPAQPTEAPKPAAKPTEKPAAVASPVAPKPAALPTDKIKMVYGNPVTPPSMVHLPAYIAQGMGFFDEVGLEVEFKSFEGGVGALRGGLAGGLDVVGTSSDPMFAAIQQGAPIKAIGTYAPRLSVVIASTPDVKKPQDLKGKKVGIQEVGGFADVMHRLLLSQVGMTEKDVQFVTVTTAGRIPALVNGQINSTHMHIDQYYAAIAQNPQIVNLANMWEIAPDWWYSAFVATEDTIKNKRDMLVRFMTAVIKAQRTLYLNPPQVKEIAVKETKRTPQEVDKAWADLSKGGVWSVNDGMPRKMIEFTVVKEAELGVIKPENKPTYEQIVFKDIVDEAIRRNGGPWTGDPRWY